MDRRKEQKPQRPYLTLHCDLCGKDYKENAWHRHGPFRCVPGKSALSLWRLEVERLFANDARMLVWLGGLDTICHHTRLNGQMRRGSD
jgi:hypothetical protein